MFGLGSRFYHHLSVVSNIDIRHGLVCPSADIAAEVARDLEPVCQVRHKDPEPRESSFSDDLRRDVHPFQDSTVPVERLGVAERFREDSSVGLVGRREDKIARPHECFQVRHAFLEGDPPWTPREGHLRSNKWHGAFLVQKVRA